MAYDIRDDIDPLEFDLKDIANGGYYPTRDNKGEISFRKKPVSPTRGRARNKRIKIGYNNGARIDDLTMAQFKADMAALWREGHTYPKIAEAVNEKYGLIDDEQYSAHDIHYHVKQMLAYWRQLAASRIDERQAMLLARLDQIEQLAVEAYFRSIEGKTTYQKNKQIERAKSKDRAKQLLDIERGERKNKFELNPRQKPLITATEDIEGQVDLLLLTAEKINKLKKTEINRAGDVKFLNLIFNINRERAKLLGLYNKDAEHDPDREAAKLSDEQREQRLVAIIQNAKQRRSESAVESALADPSPLGGFDETPAEVEQEDVPELDEDGWDFDDETEDDTQWE